MTDREYGLGRLYAPDDRDRRYAISRPAEAAGITYRYWYTGDIYHQGRTPRCVAYAGVGWLRAGPVRNLVPILQTDFAALYHECQRVDEWPGPPPDYDGTSVRALMKVLKSRGHVSEYRWTWSAGMAVDHVLAVGPMVVGTTWTEGMFEPDRHGFIRPTGFPAGGHAYLLIGAHREKECPDGSRGAVRIVNSWGAGWGQQGRAWLSIADLDGLMRDHGEAATAIEVRSA